MHFDLDEQQHAGGVTSHLDATCLVAEPITVVIDGNVTSLSVEDATRLATGLADAIARVVQHENALKGDGVSYNLAVIGSTRAGMSFLRSKLGDGDALVLDPQPGMELLPALSELAKAGRLSEIAKGH